MGLQLLTVRRIPTATVNCELIALMPMQNLEELMKVMVNKDWHLKSPSVIMEVTGSALDFELRPAFQQIFAHALVKASVSIGAWIMTGGTSAGVMKAVGTAMSDYSNATVPCIGVATWGTVQGARQLMRSGEHARKTNQGSKKRRHDDEHHPAICPSYTDRGFGRMMKECLEKGACTNAGSGSEEDLKERNIGTEIIASFRKESGCYTDERLATPHTRDLLANEVCEWLKDDSYMGDYELRYPTYKYKEIVGDWLEDEHLRHEEYKRKKKRLSSSTLDCNHTHFVLVDDTSLGQRGKDIAFKLDLTKMICSTAMNTDRMRLFSTQCTIAAFQARILRQTKIWSELEDQRNVSDTRQYPTWLARMKHRCKTSANTGNYHCRF